MKLQFRIILILVISVLVYNTALIAQVNKLSNLQYSADCQITLGDKFNSTSTVVFEDGMNGDNSITGLQSRNWVIINQDGGGESDPWFTGNDAVFNAYEGPSTGFAASNFSGANSSSTVNHWLISPLLNLNENDTLSFWLRAPDSSQFDDSISIYLALDGGTAISSFSINYVNASDNNNPRWLVPKNNWMNWRGVIPQSGNIRFAIQYYLFDADLNGDYIGLDLFQILGAGGGSNYPQNITLSNTQSFGDPANSASFKMIGLPGNINASISQYLSGSSGTDWVAYYDNGAAQDYLTAFNSTSTFNFSPGKGFWILSKNNFNINQQVSTVPLAGDNSYSIPLHSGWNIISNPFEINVSWASIRAANTITENLHSFNGSYSQASVLVPYQGYYYFNTGNAPTLKIPYTQTGLFKGTPQNKSSKNNLEIALNISGQIKSKIEIGFDDSAEKVYDALDKFAPPYDFAEHSIIIENKNYDKDYKNLISDYRPAFEDGEVYDIIIKTSESENAHLNISGCDKFKESNVILFNTDNSIVIDLNQRENIKLEQVGKINEYKLVIGNDEFVKNISSELQPTEFSLSQNFPNPFNPETIIEFTIPKKTDVKIIVYNLLGSEIAKIINEEKNPGNYRISFNASEYDALSSGVYFYSIQADEYSSVKKMIYLK
ncbi:MAG: T9SS type A sorting domain-containing protein [Ignavibacteriae bacterium]|nr:T9SS C-terminal target domain-containing protein [Ignavibacteriota bacterium]NOG98246.1 T9SS type A sorting domain-containing protein [Ignavibacteriota bacterium]